MKKMINNMIGKVLVIAGLALTILGTSACTEEVILPKFPQTQKIYFGSDEKEKEITVEANLPWTLSSSAIWCKFEDDLQKLTTVLVGEAGSSKVKMVVSDEGQKPGDIPDVAIIEMQMEDEIRVFAEVHRSAAGYELVLVDAEGKETSYKEGVIEVGYDKHLPFSVKANFDFVVTAKPGWVNLKDNDAFTGNSGVVAASGAMFVNDGYREKYSIEPAAGNTIIFSDKEGKAFFPVALRYAGFPAEEAIVEGPTIRADWEVSMDGKIFSQSGMSAIGEATTIFKDKLKYQVTTLNDDYQVVYLDRKNEGGMDVYTCSLDGGVTPWMTLSGEKGQVALTVSPAEQERSGYVFVIPTALFKKHELDVHPEKWEPFFMEQPTEENPEPEGLSYLLCQTYLVAEINQKAEEKKESANVKFFDNTMVNELASEKVTDPGLVQDYMTTEIYRLKQTVPSINIQHSLTGEFGVDWVCVAYNQMGDDKSSMVEVMPEQPVVNVWFEEALPKGETLEVIFRNPLTWENKLIVIIESNL